MAEKQTKLQAEVLAKLKAQFLTTSPKLPKSPAKVLASFLKTAELSKFICAGKQTYTNLQSSLEDRHKVKELLDMVLNKPSCKTVQEWLNANKPTEGRPFPLVPSNVEEAYFCEERQKKISKNRKREDFTPLAAAAISGDNFLVRTQLEFIHDHLKYEAGELLLKILNSEEYLAPFKNLEEANKELMKKYRILHQQYTNLNMSKDKNTWIELDKLELQVGVRQQELPLYGIQEYCKDKALDLPQHSDILVPDEDSKQVVDDLHSFAQEPKRTCFFDQEPNRSCFEVDKIKIDLALIGSSKLLYRYGFHNPSGKPEMWGARAVEVRGGSSRWRILFVKDELAFIRLLCIVRKSELYSIIQSLLKYKPKSEEIETQIEVSNAKSRNKIRV